MRAVLEAGGVVFAAREAAWIVEAASGVAATEALARDRAPSRIEGERALALARRRAAGEPLQYVTRVAGFRHLELEAGPGVFVPRPETELVAERALDGLPPGGVAVDVGTGSGAIALALALERPDATVYATEVSPAALAYARHNRAATGARVELVACDLLDGLPTALRGRVDVCVSTPPYVPGTEAAALPRDVAEHEPHVALFGGDDGLEVVRRLADAARGWLRPRGRLVLEIGAGQGAPARALLRGLGYQDVVVDRDLGGRERIAEGRL